MKFVKFYLECMGIGLCAMAMIPVLLAIIVAPMYLREQLGNSLFLLLYPLVVLPIIVMTKIYADSDD